MNFAALLMAVSAATATLTLAQKQFLSSDVITGTVTVTNSSQYPLQYFTHCGLPFSPAYIYLENGRNVITPVVTSFSECASETATVAPGTQFSFPVKLAACEVRSVACSETLALELFVNPIGTTRYNIATNEVSFTIAPDPTATFEGVNGNRPVIIAQGVASDTLTPTVGLESFTISPTQTALCSGQGEIVDLLDRAFREAGIQLGGSYSRSDPACVIGIRVDDIAGNAARLPDAMERARAALGNKMTSYREEYALESFGNLDRGPLLDARTRAQKVAAILDVAISPLAQLAGFDRGILEDEYGRRNPMPLSWPDLIFENAAPISLTLRQNWAFVGNAPARLAALLLNAPAALEYRGNYAAPFAFKAGVALKIAADRPQVFVIGAADENRALRDGLDPTAAAAAFAARRAKMVAQLLGLTARYYSLVETYPPTFMGGETSIYSAGVAMTLEGQGGATWQLARPSAPFATLPKAVAAYVPIGIPDGDGIVAGEARSTVLARAPAPGKWGDVERQAIKLALQSAIGQAFSAARARNLHLKRLVLLIVSPLDVDGDPFARPTMPTGDFTAHVRVQAFFRAAPV